MRPPPRRGRAPRPQFWGSLIPFLLAAPALAQTPAPITAPPRPLPHVSLTWSHLQGGFDNVTADTVHLDYGGKLTVDAPHLQGDLIGSRYDATGGVRVHANDTTLTADRLHVDGLQRLAFSQGAVLARRPFVVKAPDIQFQPGQLTATRANVTTARPGDSPDIELRISHLTVRPVQDMDGAATGRDHVRMDGVSLYVLHNHIITFRHLGTTIGPQPPGEPPRRRPPTPGVGYSLRFGPYIGYGSSTRIGHAPVAYDLVLPLRGAPQFSLTSRQTLLHGPRLRPETPFPPPPAPGDPLAAIRALTTAPTPLLPPGDPLLFHDFLPGGNLVSLFDQPSTATLNANEEVSAHIPTEGNGRSDLYVTRYPEINLSGSIPLTPVYGLPAPDDPATFRAYLRHLVVYAGASVDVGQFYEQSGDERAGNMGSPDGTSASGANIPTSVDAGRLRSSVSLYTRPLLLAPNTVFSPSYTVTTNHYTGTSRTYSYSQYSLAVSHFFSDYSALGVRYTGSQVGGASRFNFDVLNASRELDGRLQLGDRHLTLAGGINYDLQRRHIIDYTIAVAPGLRGFTPVFSFQFFSRTFGLNFAIPGLNF